MEGRGGGEEERVTYAPLKITLVVATFNLGRKLNINDIALRNPFIIRFSNSFAAGMISLKYPECICSIYPSGKCVITGAKQPIHAEVAAYKCCKILRTKFRLFYVHVNNFRIVNMMVNTAIIGREINIKEMYNHEKACVEKNSFPNCVLKSNSSLTLTVFESGSINIAGITTFQAAQQGLEKAKSKIEKYLY